MGDLTRIGFAIAGCGTIAAYHARAIIALPDAAFVGAYSRTYEHAAAFCKTFGGAAFDEYPQLLEHPAVDAVAICSPSESHFVLAKQALLHRKHVIIEKPICLTLPEADELLSLGRQTERSISVISQTRFSPGVQAAAEAIRSGAFGERISAALRMRYFRSQDYYDTAAWRRATPGGGVLMNQGIHGIDLLCWLMGRPTQVCGFARTACRQMEAENTVAAAVLFDSGAVATIDATTCSQPGFPRRLTLCGENGTIVLDEDSVELWSLPAPCPVPLHEASGSSGAASPTGILQSGHTQQYANILSHLLHGTPLLVDGAQGRTALALILGILEASRTGTVVTL